MDLELVTIGSELLLGFTVDSNGAEIAQALAQEGIRVVRRTTVPDEAPAIRAAVADALSRTGAVLTTGGLGPTRDDVTKKVVADLFDAPLEFDAAVWGALLDRYARLERTPAESNKVQAEVPRGARILANRWGTAPGLWLEGPPGLAILLPGVPSEMRKLLEHEVIPRLRDRGRGRVIRSVTLRTTGIAESSLAERVGDIEQEIDPLTLAFLPGLTGVDLRLTIRDTTASEAELRLTAALELLRQRVGDCVFATEQTDLAEVVLEAARSRGLRIAVAESCTGGLLGQRLTAIPGSSDVFTGGIIAYENRVKCEVIGVPPECLAEHGAVSEPVALAMAQGAARLLHADAAISVTGIAGPTGGTEDKPVGLVCFGFVVGGSATTERRILFGNRVEIRARAAQAALWGLLRRLRPPVPA